MGCKRFKGTRLEHQNGASRIPEYGRKPILRAYKTRLNVRQARPLSALIGMRLSHQIQVRPETRNTRCLCGRIRPLLSNRCEIQLYPAGMNAGTLLHEVAHLMHHKLTGSWGAHSPLWGRLFAVACEEYWGLVQEVKRGQARLDAAERRV